MHTVDSPLFSDFQSTLDLQRVRALDVLLLCAQPSGLLASGKPYGHHQVWARDSMISLLGGCLTGDEAVRSSLVASLSTLKAHQTASGAIPNHVDTGAARPNFRAYADGGLWFVIGSSILSPDLGTIERVLRWYECQDVDQSGLLSFQEAADWQDLFCTRGKTLYGNCLYTLALRKAAAIASACGKHELASAWTERGGLVREKLNDLFWYRGDGQMLRHIAHSFSTPNAAHDSLGRPRWTPAKRVLAEERYYLPYLSFRNVGEWFDVFGNLLAILAGVAGEDQASAILDSMERHGLAERPVRAIFPSIHPGDPDWRNYYGSLNLPDHYHNGGIWPFLGGFYVAALVETGRFSQAQQALERLAQLNRDGNFNEWHHGATGEPMGVQAQAWSAGMYIFAHECVKRGEVPLL